MSRKFSPRLLLLQGAFWTVVFTLNVGPQWQKYGSPRELFEVVGTTTALQALVALIALRYLVPHLLDRGRVKQFGILLLVLLFVVAESNILFSYFYLEPAYPDSYGKYYQILSDLSLIERLGFSSMIRWIVFSKLPLFFFPAAVLIAVDYYQRQQSVLALREQKRSAELDALKNQLNPHFIFNTLNNIYALAIKGSDQTAEAIAKLSGILDYVLYRCNSEYVSLNDEVNMIDDYIALERLRFGDRLAISFVNEVREPVEIAPLLFLTLIENAFKHGASQALDTATVDLSLSASEKQIAFEVSNSTSPSSSSDKPSNAAAGDRPPGIGLKNLRRQLDLLYPNAHRLSINESDKQFTARLVVERDQK
ncbi:sensor histidine kinase [Congregibacter brevis]|uniref:Sensor histidine kinase n=1 Tax=Congregibacter brevis TaxID=3081201 RepID=A0ABZ0IEZ5_9GAMM|nr:sensor histidine kinase [Congregibacter sp. IMCC45268]